MTVLTMARTLRNSRVSKWSRVRINGNTSSSSEESAEWRRIKNSNTWQQKTCTYLAPMYVTESVTFAEVQIQLSYGTDFRYSDPKMVDIGQIKSQNLKEHLCYCHKCSYIPDALPGPQGPRGCLLVDRPFLPDSSCRKTHI